MPSHSTPPPSRATVTQFPVSQEVSDGMVTFRVRRISNEVQLSVEVMCIDRDSGACVTFPRVLPDTAALLARYLLEASCGHPLDWEAVMGVLPNAP